jgi:putative ABC transport system permease protein
MIQTMFNRAYRSFLKNKFFSTLNMMGLALGMAVFLLTAQYVKFETSYEDFVPEGDNIYRLTLDTYVGPEHVRATAENFPAAGPALTAALPEIEKYALRKSKNMHGCIIWDSKTTSSSPTKRRSPQWPLSNVGSYTQMLRFYP